MALCIGFAVLTWGCTGDSSTHSASATSVLDEDQVSVSSEQAESGPDQLRRAGVENLSGSSGGGSDAAAGGSLSEAIVGGIQGASSNSFGGMAFAGNQSGEHLSLDGGTDSSLGGYDRPSPQPAGASNSPAGGQDEPSAGAGGYDEPGVGATTLGGATHQEVSPDAFGGTHASVPDQTSDIGGVDAQPLAGISLGEVPEAGLESAGGLSENAAEEAWDTSAVFRALEGRCGVCHAAGTSLPFFESESRFADDLVNDPSYVVVGDADNSALIDLLRGDARGLKYTQMPPGPQSYADLQIGDPSLPSLSELSVWINNLPSETVVPDTVVCRQSTGDGVLPRLNRAEYDASVRDILFVDSTPASDFPSDDHSFGFDNVDAVLPVTPLLVEKYDLAAEQLANEVIPSGIYQAVDLVIQGEDMEGTNGRATGETYLLWSNGSLSAEISIVTAGDYTLRASVRGDQAGPELVSAALLVNDAEVSVADVAAVSGERDIMTHTMRFAPGTHTIGVSFRNDYYCPQDRFDSGECSGLGDRNLHIDYVTLEGPTDVDPPETTAFEARYVDCDLDLDAPEDCALDAIGRVGRLLWRRALTEAELARFGRLVDGVLDQGDDFRSALRVSLQALLLSPKFIFRVEQAHPADEFVSLPPHELAARLSYFLWSSAPDDELLARAEDGTLSESAVLDAQVSRMLAHPRSAMLGENFGGQWLHFRDVANLDPEYALFPEFDGPLQSAMRMEAQHWIHYVIDSNRPFVELFDAPYAFVNPRLARHYGIEGVFEADGAHPMASEDGFLFLENGVPGRRGFLTSAAWLAVTSHRGRTSPVNRGKFVLEQLLCTPPPPPPPSVEGLIEDNVEEEATLRQKMEQHRADPACSACHINMDAIGFAFEHFDAIGAQRETDQGMLIDASGQLFGRQFDGADEVIDIVANDSRLERCIAEKLMIYALGRGIDDEEACYIDNVADEAAQSGFTSHALIRAVADSPLFKTKAGVEEARR